MTAAAAAQLSGLQLGSGSSCLHSAQQYHFAAAATAATAAPPQVVMVVVAAWCSCLQQKSGSSCRHKDIVVAPTLLVVPLWLVLLPCHSRRPLHHNALLLPLLEQRQQRQQSWCSGLWQGSGSSRGTGGQDEEAPPGAISGGYNVCMSQVQVQGIPIVIISQHPK